MEYNIEEIKKITQEYKLIRKSIIKRLKEIGYVIEFFDKYWVFEDYDIDFDKNIICITAYDSGYDGYDTKNIEIPLRWLTCDNWLEEYNKIKEEEKRKEEEKKLRMQKEQEQKEYETYLKLQEKYKNIERK